MSGEPSPRTVAQPMAFTRGEFVRGAISAWLWAIGILIVGWTVAIPFWGLLSAIYVLPAATIALVVFAAPTWFVAHTLRRVASVAVHTVALATIGVVIGIVATTALVATGTAGYIPFGALAMSNALAAALAMVLGWRRGARAVLRSRTPEPADPDAAAEDATADRAQRG